MLSALRGVLKTAWRLGLMDAETYRRAVAVENVKARVQPKGRAVEQDELAALFRVCAEDPSPAGRRDAALFAVLYGGGLRRAELCGLDLADFDALDCALTVRAGKGRRDRTVYLPAAVCRHLCSWVEVREGEPGPLFCPVRSTGEVPITRLRGEAVWYILKRRQRQAGLEGISPHGCRKAYVTGLLAAGVDLLTVQELVGHADAVTTAKYDRRGNQAKLRAAQQLPVPSD
jgi:site-specific recombinase XerD